jgi:Na+/proline symporter
VAIKGTIVAGGFSAVWERNYESGRIQWPDFRPDPRIRQSFWSLVVGGSIFYMSATGLNQNMIQRFMAVKTVKKARIANWINMALIICIITICCYNGLLMYAMYHDCDLIASKNIPEKKRDKLLPMMIMEKFGDLPGFAGLFTAGVFAAALSTLSTAYNSMAAVAFEDICKTLVKGKISDWTTFLIMRGTVFILGCVSVALVYVIQNLGDLLQLTYTIPATSLGPMLGVFFIGICLPWLGKKSTFYSAFVVYFTMLTMVIVIQTKVATGAIKYDGQPLSTAGCTFNFTLATTTIAPEPELEKEPSRSISHLYFTMIGAMVVIILSALLSLIFGFEDPKKVDPKLLAPFLRKYMESKNKETNEKTQYDNPGLELREAEAETAGTSSANLTIKTTTYLQ